MENNELLDEINDLLEVIDEEGSDETGDTLEEGEEVSEEDGSDQEDEKPEEDADDEGADEDSSDSGDSDVDDSDADLTDESSDDADDDSSDEEVADPNLSVIEELRAQNLKLMEMIQAGNKPDKPAEDKPAEEKKPPKTLESLLDEVSFEEIMSDKDLFMSFMQNAMQIAQENSVERVATTMPQYVLNQVEQQRILQEATTNFYTANEKLVPHKKIVGMLTNEVIAEHQDWPLEKVLTETAERSYKLLNLKKEALNQDKPDAPEGRRNKKPALNKRNSSGKRPAPKLSKLQKEINELF